VTLYGTAGKLPNSGKPHGKLVKKQKLPLPASLARIRWTAPAEALLLVSLRACHNQCNLLLLLVVVVVVVVA
jgi:hypothetical protein